MAFPTRFMFLFLFIIGFCSISITTTNPTLLRSIDLDHRIFNINSFSEVGMRSMKFVGLKVMKSFGTRSSSTSINNKFKKTTPPSIFYGDTEEMDSTISPLFGAALTSKEIGDMSPTIGVLVRAMEDSGGSKFENSKIAPTPKNFNMQDLVFIDLENNEYDVLFDLKFEEVDNAVVNMVMELKFLPSIDSYKSADVASNISMVDYDMDSCGNMITDNGTMSRQAEWALHQHLNIDVDPFFKGNSRGNPQWHYLMKGSVL